MLVKLGDGKPRLILLRLRLGLKAQFTVISCLDFHLCAEPSETRPLTVWLAGLARDLGGSCVRYGLKSLETITTPIIGAHTEAPEHFSCLTEDQSGTIA